METEIETYHRYDETTRIVEEMDNFGVRYRFEAPMFEDSPEWEIPEKAELYADVYFAVGGFREEKTGERGVPPAVARAGQNVMVAYLACQPSMSVTWAARAFDLSEGTVRTYLSRVRKRAGDRRDDLEDDVVDDDQEGTRADHAGDPTPDESSVDSSSAESATSVDDPRREIPGLVEKEIVAFDPPGDGDLQERRRDAIRAAYRHLREHGTATRSDFLEVYDQEPAGYDSASPKGSWWRRVVRPGLQHLPDVEEPTSGGSKWRYTGGS